MPYKGCCPDFLFAAFTLPQQNSPPSVQLTMALFSDHSSSTEAEIKVPLLRVRTALS